VVEDVKTEWSAARTSAMNAGLDANRIFFDPGLGFHKSAAHSSELMRRLDEFQGLGAGLVLGASRKSFIGALDDSAPEDRLGGSIAACLLAVQKGAQILRVHDVRATSQALLGLQCWSKRGASDAKPAHA
jgi:dihydropteroate synthase